MGQISNITTRWRHKKVIKHREIEVDNSDQKAVNHPTCPENVATPVAAGRELGVVAGTTVDP